MNKENMSNEKDSIIENTYITDLKNYTSSATSGLTIYEYVRYANLSSNIKSNFIKARPLINDTVYKTRIDDIEHFRFNKLSEDLSPSSKSLKIARDAVTDAKTISKFVAPVNAFQVGYDTYDKYITSNGDVSQTLSTLTASSSYNYGGTATAAYLGSLAGTPFASPEIGAAGAVVLFHILNFFGFGDVSIKWASDKIDIAYEFLGEKLFIPMRDSFELQAEQLLENSIREQEGVNQLVQSINSYIQAQFETKGKQLLENPYFSQPTPSPASPEHPSTSANQPDPSSQNLDNVEREIEEYFNKESASNPSVPSDSVDSDGKTTDASSMDKEDTSLSEGEYQDLLETYNQLSTDKEVLDFLREHPGFFKKFTEEIWDSYPSEHLIADIGDEQAMRVLAAQRAQAQAAAEEQARIEAEQEWAKVRQDAEARQASVEAYGSQNQFARALEDGDALEIARTYAHYMTAQDTNARKQGYEAQLSDAAHAAFSAAANGLDLTQAIRSGDGWGIAGETAALLRDIDSYVRATGGSFLGTDGNAALGTAQSAINLAAAIDGGDEWAIAGSALGLMQNFSNHPGLSTAASAVSLAINIANLDDVFATGDTGQIVYALGSTTIDAINTYNFGMEVVGATGTSGATNFAPYLAYAAAALQAVEGDVRGAAVNAAATTMIYYGDVYVKAAGFVLLVANALLGGKSAPPKAHGSFGLDENGQVVLVEVHGNGKMLGHAREFGNDMLPVLQGYHDSGGRLLIDGTMPTFTLTAGEALKIKYGNEGIGRVEVIVADSSRAQVEMLGALYARDRGDRIEEAIKVSRDAFGNIDFARADAILAGQGFVKKGLTYTFGETQSSTGTTRGTGERHGGGNVGPEGQVIAARNENIVSLPLRPEQLPGQRIGEILGVAGLQSNFTGWGNELFLMSLIAGGGVFGVAGPAFGKVEQEETNTDYIKPLDAVELSLYERLVASGSVGAEQQVQDADAAAMPRLSGSELQQFLDAHWDKLLAAGNPFTDLPASSAYYYRNQSELIGYGRLLPDGSKALAAPDNEAWWQNWDRLLFTSSHSSSTDSASLAEAGLGLINASSYSGRAVTEQQWQAAQDALQSGNAGGSVPPLPPAVEQGAFFLTPQDSTLRFLDSALLQEAGNAYADSASALRFAGFGESQHGRVWRDANGDIRFEAEPGFVGTASFLYLVENAQGEIITRRALVTVSDVNDPPLLQDDEFSVEMNTPFALNRLLANDSDPEGDTLSFDHFRGIEHGSIAYVNGELVFTPEAGFTGSLDFSYWVTDRPGAYPGMAMARLNYVNSQGLPNLSADRFIILEETPLSIAPERLLANDTDGGSLEIVAVDNAKHGTVQLQADGSIVFTPDADYSGTEAGFSYTARNISTPAGPAASAWVSVEVLNVREAPVVSAGSIGPIDAGASLVFSPEVVAGFVYDGDGDALHLNYIKNAIGGTVVSENGVLRFVADKDFTGTASFDYQADDNHRGTVEGHLEFEVRPVNQPIVLGPDSLSMLEEQSLIISTASLMTNDVDPEGGPITWHSLGAAAHGTVQLDADGNITFTPDADYFGDQAGFNYTVSDGEGLLSSGFVQVKVQNVNDAPVIQASSISSQEDEALVFDAARLAIFLHDADGDQLSLSAISEVSGGSMRLVDGVYVFTPEENFHGQAAFAYTASDGTTSVDGRLSIDIAEVDDPAVFVPVELATEEESPVSTTVADLMARASDADGGLQFNGVGPALHGLVTWDAGTGALTFTPDADYFGEQAGFSYRVIDAHGHEASAFVAVQVSNINDAPVITATSLSLQEDTPFIFDQAGISAFAQDADGDKLSLSSLELIEGSGSISLENGRYVFTPEADFSGLVGLSYTLSDGVADAVQGRLDLQVAQVDDPTFFGADSYTTLEEEAITISPAELLANDTDTDGALSFVSAAAPRHGTLETNSDGDIVFTPEKDYFGKDAGFSYTVKDANGFFATAWVAVQVENVDDAPEILFDQAFLQEDEKWELNAATLASFIRDADGDPLSIEQITEVQGGVFSQNNGVYTFIPDADYYGAASFTYVVTDGVGAPVQGRMAITIAPVNDLPEVALSTAAMEEDGEITFAVQELLAGAHDVEDGANLRFGGIDRSISGDAWLDDAGLIHFLPNDNFAGQAFLRYKVLDSEGGVGYGHIHIDVAGVNDAPVAVDDSGILAWSNNLYENVYSASALLGNDVDVDGDTLKIVGLGPAEFGTVSLDSLGNISYTAAAANWVGIDTFTYRITDGNGGFAEARASIDVKINTSPDAYAEVITTQEDVVSVLQQSVLLANDSDIDGDHLFITSVAGAEHCTVQLLDDGSILFVPELNYNNLYPGQASFAYTVSDGISDPVTTRAFFDILPVNDAPVLTPERLYGAIEDNSFTFTASQLMANDTDVEMASPYEEDSLTFAGVHSAAHGSISWDAGSGTIFYTPNPNYNGIETFQYTVSDAHGGQSTITSEIYITPVNDRPVVEYDYGSAAEEVIWTYYKISNLLANDSDVDGDALSIINPYVIKGSAQIKLTSDSLAVMPTEGSAGSSVVIGYTVTDNNGGETLSRLTINEIRDHNYAPTFSGVYTAKYYEYNVNAEREWGVLDFAFHAEDKNGGNTWGSGPNPFGDIMDLSIHPISSSGYDPDFKFVEYNGHTYALHFDRVKSGSSLLFSITATDYSGASGTIVVDANKMHTGGGWYQYHGPVVLDLDGNGVDLLNLSAGVAFDWNRDGIAEATSWVAGSDAFLVYDYDHNRIIDRADEIALSEYAPGASTDLEGLRTFDSNQDGVFDARDEQWASFGLWQDKNSNGISDEDEFSYLSETDIASINLYGEKNSTIEDGNIIHETVSFTRTDGTTGLAADVALQGEKIDAVRVDFTFGDVKTQTGLFTMQQAAESDMTGTDANTGTTASVQAGATPAEALAGTDMSATAQTQQPSLDTTAPADSSPAAEANDLLCDAVLNTIAAQIQSDAALYPADNSLTQDYASPDVGPLPAMETAILADMHSQIDAQHQNELAVA